MWLHMADYFNAQLIKTADLDPHGKYVFACYPHGISALSGWINFATEATGFSKLFPGTPACTVSNPYVGILGHMQASVSK